MGGEEEKSKLAATVVKRGVEEGEGEGCDLVRRRSCRLTHSRLFSSFRIEGTNGQLNRYYSSF